MSRGDRWGLALVIGVLFGSLGWFALRVQNGAERDEGSEESPAARSPETSNPEASPDASAVPEVEATAVAEPPPSAAARLSKWNARALEALAAGDFEEAVELLEECHAAEPDEPVFAHNLAEALARAALAAYEEDAELESALERIERALELAPEREDLVVLADHWRGLAAAQEDFWTDETTHFRLSYDGGRADLLEHGYGVLTAALEAAYADFRTTFDADPARVGRPKIKVVLYQRDEFDDLTGIGHWAGGVYDGVVRVPVVDFHRERRRLVQVLRHEVVHAFLSEVGADDVPAWLNEGLAQWYEHESPSERKAAVNRARTRLAQGELFPLSELRTSFTTWRDTDAIARGYAQALALVDYIDTWYGERVLQRMAAGCAEGKTVEESFRERLGIELSDVVGDLEADL